MGIFKEKGVEREMGRLSTYNSKLRGHDGEIGNVDLSNSDVQNVDNDEVNGRIAFHEIQENVKKLKKLQVLWH